MEHRHVALVTGAGRGIGAAIAGRLAQAGAVVVLASRTIAECESAAQRIRAAGGTAVALALDVGEPASIAAAVAEARERTAAHGPLDWLVNNAGIAVSAPLLAKGGDGDELYERHMRINFHGARRVAEALLPGMKQCGHGRVVNIASSAALRGDRYIAAYAASKHALLGWARSAAVELEGSGVAVSTVCPHYVDSPMTDDSIRRVVAKTGRNEAEARAFFESRNPGGRLVAPEQIAAVVLDLCQGESNGALVELDGGAPRYHPAQAAP